MAIDVEHPPVGARLELYISPSCPYCREARAYYDAHGVPYTTHDAQNDRRERESMLALTKGDPTVPAIVIDGAYVQSGWGHPPRG
ncbi:MAG TPA: glutaredoxin domain-containing protein [Candidatus Baltobacteraceae bacterium]|nr:glutaredoxin domain-containing protein [Candidatus Baltobacteraceae bacterium]